MSSALRSVVAACLLLMVGLVIAADPARNLAVQDSSAVQRVALVIGNSSYPGAAALRNPANDATDIAAKLKKLGFDVTLRTNFSQKEMLRALTDFGDKIQQGTEALFFYAGHGMQVRGKNYLIPIDAEIRTESAVSSEAVDVDQLLDKLSLARLSMVILDACRNNPFERRFRGGGQGLASINAPTGTLIAYATAPGKVASDGDGRNGLYTQELLAAMETPGAKVEDVFKRVRANVVRKSNDAQTPWESSSLTGDFYFIFQGPATFNIQAASAAIIAPAPATGGLSLDDLRGQQESRAQWAKWQANMKADYDKVTALNAEADIKAAAWGRFLASYAQENPYSAEDKILRAQAQQWLLQSQDEAQRQKAEADQKKREAEAAAQGIRPSIAANTPSTTEQAGRFQELGRVSSIWRDLGYFEFKMTDATGLAPGRKLLVEGIGKKSIEVSIQKIRGMYASAMPVVPNEITLIQSNGRIGEYK